MEYPRLVCNKKQREGEYMALFPKFSKKKDGVNVVMEQRLLQNTSNLILNAETCTGCGICVDACPEEAIVLGLVGASRRGAINYAARSMLTRPSVPTVVSASSCARSMH